MQRTFIIDDSRKDFVYREAGRLLRSFRSSLSTKYLHNEDGTIREHPPPLYAGIIKDEHWKVFVDVHIQESFQVNYEIIFYLEVVIYI